MSTVDAIIPVHDARRPIQRSARSILANRSASVRVLVIAHNVDAEQVRAALGELADDKRVTVREFRDGLYGPSTPKNYGLSLAGADYVTFVDSDDELEPGTLDRWLRIAEDEHADFVVGNEVDSSGRTNATPPVRIGRRTELDGVKDRLAYRAAVRGLIRRASLGNLRFPEGVDTGEDIPFSGRIWFSPMTKAFAFGAPGYLLHDDQAQRLTTDSRSVRGTLLWLDGVLDPGAPWMHTRDTRIAQLVKLLRHNFPDAAAARIPGGWNYQAKREMRAALLRIYRAEPRTLDYLSRADWRLLTALVSGRASEEEVASLLEAHRRLRSVEALIPHRAGLLFSRQGPLRTHLAGAALAHARSANPTGVELDGTPVDADFSAGRMIFHAPFPVQDGATSASGIRPWKMLQAFRDLGYDVFTLTGYAKERRAQFALLKSRMRQGWRPDFCYSEAATIPSSFTEPKHVPLVLNLDRDIFRFLHAQRVPTGVFYRDVYWAFPDYVAQVGKPVAAAMRCLYHREIETFNRFVDVVFLPTQRMAEFVPGLKIDTVALPPGADEPEADSLPRDSKPTAKCNPGAAARTPLRLFYVGGIGGEHYDISALLRAVRDTDGVTLTICTRPDSWQAAKVEYADLLSDHVKVVHESGDGLLALYRDSDVACLVMRPQEYRSFAAPMKLYEYLGQGLPVLASQDTHAAGVVEETEAGWVVPFGDDAIARQLVYLRDNPGEVDARASAAREQGPKNTWAARADFAAQALAGREKRSSINSEDADPGLVSDRAEEDLHVLVVPSWYPKDDEDTHGSFFREQAEALAESGMQVGVLALKEVPVYTGGVNVDAGLTITEENGLNVVRGQVPRRVPMQRALNVKLSSRRVDKAWDAYVSRFGEPDVIHAHSLYPGAFYARDLSRKHGIPFVYTEHRSLSHMPVKTALGRKVERAVAAAATSRHAVSQGHAHHLRNRFGLSQWDYTPNLLPRVVEAADLYGSDLGVPSGDTYTFGHLSVLDPVKRVDRLIDAFAVVHGEDDSTRLLIGGSGVTQEELEQQVEARGLVGAVRFLGPLPRGEVPDFYQSIDAFVLPSATETMGVVQIEALSAGVPVVSTRTWGGETIIEEGDGLLVDIDEHDQLVAALREIRAAGESAAARRERRERAIARFGREAFVGRYREIYRRASQWRESK